MKEPKAYHRSTWVTCDVCKEEFMGQRAKICRDCRQKMYEKSSWDKYQEWVGKGNKPKEM